MATPTIGSDNFIPRPTGTRRSRMPRSRLCRRRLNGFPNYFMWVDREQPNLAAKGTALSDSTLSVVFSTCHLRCTTVVMRVGLGYENPRRNAPRRSTTLMMRHRAADGKMAQEPGSERQEWQGHARPRKGRGQGRAGHRRRLRESGLYEDRRSSNVRRKNAADAMHSALARRRPLRHISCRRRRLQIVVTEERRRCVALCRCIHLRL